MSPARSRQVGSRRARGEHVSLTEIALRVNYMGSIAWASVGLIFLLAYPYDSRLLSVVVLFAAVPYFPSMAADLKATGYRYSDIASIYGFNLVLLPVNLAGVIKSIEQSITMRKIPFSRTPKVRNRTAAPWLYVVVPWLIVLFSVLTFVRDYSVGNWGNAVFAAVNATLGFWAIVSYIGIWNSIVDIWLGLTAWFWVDIKPSRKARRAAETAAPASIDWRSVLYHGEAEPIARSHQIARSHHPRREESPAHQSSDLASNPR